MKKKFFIILICLLSVCLVFGGFALYTAVKNSDAKPVSAAKSAVVLANDPIYYTAHRGFSGIAPENTLPALQKAGQAGYFACEIDVRCTKDGVWVLMHDEAVDRTTNGRGKVNEYSYAKLSEFFIDGGKGIEEYENLKIPTLEQALDILEEYEMLPMIEIKSGSESEIEQLFNILKTRDILDDIILISFNFAHLEQLRSLSNSVELWQLISELEDDNISQAAKLNIQIAFDGRKIKNHEKVQSILDADLKAAAWTIDDIKLHDTLYELGVRYITTNLITP